jgi:hypothetical protein
MAALTGVAKGKGAGASRGLAAGKGIAAGKIGVVAAVAVASLVLPLVGIPLALACLAYAGIKRLAPHRVIRGRVLSELQQHRVAIIAGAAILGVAAGCSTVIFGLGVAGRLEHQLRVDIDHARDVGDLKASATFRECEEVMCATATIVQLPTNRTLGVAKLSGMTLHPDTLFGWHKAHLTRFITKN